eukprot:SAG31_NODE_2108_length_6427_cov_7.816688_1_plen_94_part_00
MDTLVAMGFDVHDCTGALAQTANDVNAALNLLLEGYKAPPAASPSPPHGRQHRAVAVVAAGQPMEVECNGARMQGEGCYTFSFLCNYSRNTGL